MIHMLIVDGQADELWLIQREAHEQAALLTDERWEIHGTLHLEMQEIREKEVLDIAYLDVTDAQGLAAAMAVRKWWKNVYMVLIVSESLSPVQYLRPSIMAASVLLRPVEQMQAAESIREAIHWLPGKADDEDVFVFADRDGKLRIPYGQILYFEARAKKIYIALQNEEYGFYDSMGSPGTESARLFFSMSQKLYCEYASPAAVPGFSGALYSDGRRGDSGVPQLSTTDEGEVFSMENGMIIKKQELCFLLFAKA